MKFIYFCIISALSIFVNSCLLLTRGQNVEYAEQTYWPKTHYVETYFSEDKISDDYSLMRHAVVSNGSRYSLIDYLREDA